MNARVNNSEACICCSRRADGVAVGRPGKLGWYCNDCGPDLAKVALAMMHRDLDNVEKRAAVLVAEAAGQGEIVLKPEELPAFVSWVVKEFADTMRKQFENGAPPF